MSKKGSVILRCPLIRCDHTFLIAMVALAVPRRADEGVRPYAHKLNAAKRCLDRFPEPSHAF